MSETGANTPRRIGFAIFLGILFLGIAAVAPYLFDLFFSIEPDTPTQTLAQQIGAQPTQAQKIPAQIALQEIRERENKLGNSYGWVDARAGIVRVPIDRARSFVLERGLPSR
jgi:hypothetical protein